MARTSTGGTPTSYSMKALDDLDLDGMLEGGGDDFFGDVDMDLANIADITGAPLTADAVAQPLPSPEEEPASPPKETTSSTPTTTTRTGSRRKKAPVFYEDNDDEPPPKKKKGAKSSSTSSKRGGKKGKAAPDDSTKSPLSSAAASTTSTTTTTTTTSSTSSSAKSKKAKSGAISKGPVGRAGTAGSTVAAAGQFGRNSSFTSISRSRTKLPSSRTSDSSSNNNNKKSSSKSKSKASASASAEPPAQSAAQSTLIKLQKILEDHPGLRSAFCGLYPSNTLFYPFLPALPDVLTIRRKNAYQFLDKLSSNFTNNNNSSSNNSSSNNQNATTPKSTPEAVVPATEAEAILKLMQDSQRESSGSGGNPTTAEDMNSPEKVAAMGKTIGTARQMLRTMDQTKLVGDLYAMCALLKRQHDFLNQNLDNMEKWCQRNFSEAEYKAVYAPPNSKKRKADGISEESFLKQFNKQLLKVKIVGNGVKMNSPFYLAQLPPEFAPATPETTPKPASNKAKKRKTGNEVTTKSTKSPTSTVTVKDKVLPYSDCKPLKRRKHVSELLSRAVRDLEVQHQRKVDEQTQAVRKQETELRRVVDEDEIPVLHTNGMWQWVKKAGFFAPITGRDARNRLEVLRHESLPPPKPGDEEGSSTMGRAAPIILKADHQHAVTAKSSSCVLDRLTALLVDEGSLDGDESDSELDNMDIPEILDDGEGGDLDMSALTEDERSLIHQHTLQMNVSLLRPRSALSSALLPNVLDQPVAKDETQIDDDYVEGVIERMMLDLRNLESLNAQRADYLEALSTKPSVSVDGAKQKRELESSAISRCQTLMKKNRESKTKPAKAKTKEDPSLPW